jgi:hypothetical protein
MKRLLLSALLLFCFAFGYSQVSEPEKKLREASKDTVDGWKKGGMIMLNFGQTSLTNWAAGGENSLSGNGIFNMFGNYKKGNFTWDNNIDLGYGILKQGSDNRKSDDKIEFSTKFGKAAAKNWYYAGLLNFRSQFTAGYNYPNDSVKISDFFAPAYIVTAIGMDYKPGKTFTAFIAPITGKITIVADPKLADAGAFGVDPAVIENGIKTKDGKNFRQEFGGYVRIGYQDDIMENVNLSTKLDLFSNYSEKPQNVDVNWQVLLSMKVNKFISASLSTQLIYDDDINYKDGGPRTQFKEILGVGFSYKF